MENNDEANKLCGVGIALDEQDDDVSCKAQIWRRVNCEFCGFSNGIPIPTWTKFTCYNCTMTNALA